MNSRNKQVLRVVTFVLLLAFSAFSAHAEPVNVNTASANEIAQALHGVGLKKAGDIVSFRERNGGFGKIEDLTFVKGIGEKTVEKNRSNILLSN